MKVELLYLKGCPNSQEAAIALHQALTLTLHRDAQVDLVRLDTQEPAEPRGFVGSPTVLIDGRDPFATGDEQFGLACRVLRTAEGLAGSPERRHADERVGGPKLARSGRPELSTTTLGRAARQRHPKFVVGSQEPNVKGSFLRPSRDVDCSSSGRGRKGSGCGEKMSNRPGLR